LAGPVCGNVTRGLEAASVHVGGAERDLGRVVGDDAVPQAERRDIAGPGRTAEGAFLSPEVGEPDSRICLARGAVDVQNAKSSRDGTVAAPAVHDLPPPTVRTDDKPSRVATPDSPERVGDVRRTSSHPGSKSRKAPSKAMARPSIARSVRDARPSDEQLFWASVRECHATSPPQASPGASVLPDKR
jgi:hypothetical protein